MTSAHTACLSLLSTPGTRSMTPSLVRLNIVNVAARRQLATAQHRGACALASAGWNANSSDLGDMCVAFGCAPAWGQQPTPRWQLPLALAARLLGDSSQLLADNSPCDPILDQLHCHSPRLFGSVRRRRSLLTARCLGSAVPCSASLLTPRWASNGWAIGSRSTDFSSMVRAACSCSHHAHEHALDRTAC